MTVKELKNLLNNFPDESSVELTVEGWYDAETGAIEITSSINSVTLVIHEDFTVTTHPNKYVVTYWRGSRAVAKHGRTYSKQFDNEAEAQRFALQLSDQAFFTETRKANA